MTAIPNVQGPVGLRALCWREGQDEFISPAYSVRWEWSGLLVAGCKNGCVEIPGDRCRCGVYVALFPWLAKQYLRGQGSALFLVEGCGKTRIPGRNLRGFRAEQGYVLAAVVEGDAEKPVEDAMLAEPGLASTLLKVGHHGSLSSTRPEFLARVAPQWAVISCGLRNRYGHPRKEVLRELESAKVRTYSTDVNGAACFLLDGKTASPDLACGWRALR